MASTPTATTAKIWKRAASSCDDEPPLCVPDPKRRSIDCTTTHSGNNSNRSSGDFAAVPSPTCSEVTNSLGPGRVSSAPTPASPQPHVGVPASAAEQPLHSSKAPAVGIPLAMPSGFDLPFPFMPPPLVYFWMQQMALQQAATYLDSQQKSSCMGSVPCPPPTNAACKPDVWDTGIADSCPATSPSCSSMPQPPPFPPTGSPHSISSLPPPPSQMLEPCPSMPIPLPMPPFPSCLPPPPPAMPLPDLAHLPPPEELPHIAESLDSGCARDDVRAPGKVEYLSSDCSVSEAGVLDNDVASFIDSFLLSGPEQTLHCNTPQVDLVANDKVTTPPLGLHLSRSAAEEVLDALLHHDNDDEAGMMGDLMAGLPPAEC